MASQHHPTANREIMDQPLTTREVAAYCGVSAVAVWKWIRAGKLPATRTAAGHYSVDRAAFRTYLQQRNLPIDPAWFTTPVKRILVVDDEESILEIANRALHQGGDVVDVATAKDGFEAGLQVATFRPDLLILDLLMPGVDGFEVCRLIKRNPSTAHTRILIITAYGSHENIRRALEAGADDFMHKPVDLQELRDKASALLARP
jgi:excisionase family DNA binding protein